MTPTSNASAPDEATIQKYLRTAIEAAAQNASVDGGPFGAVVVTADGQHFTAVNRVTADHDPTEADTDFLTAMADQVAVAVDNARLLGELEGKAALEERHRLARELHDSVSQALFSMNLTARATQMAVQQTGDRWTSAGWR